MGEDDGKRLAARALRLRCLIDAAHALPREHRGGMTAQQIGAAVRAMHPAFEAEIAKWTTAIDEGLRILEARRPGEALGAADANALERWLKLARGF